MTNLFMYTLLPVCLGLPGVYLLMAVSSEISREGGREGRGRGIGLSHCTVSVCKCSPVYSRADSSPPTKFPF